jgi:DNA-binding IscR family transcriptional regulator
MNQEILTIIIISAAVIIAVLMIVRYFRKRKKSKSPCAGCSSDCTGCAIHDLMERVEENKKNT